MQITGVVGTFNTTTNRFSKDGQKVLSCVGFKVKGSALDFARYGLNTPDGATSDTSCEDFVDLNYLKQILSNGGRVVGLVLTTDRTMQLSRNSHLYDYKLYLTERKSVVSMDVFNSQIGSPSRENLFRAGLFTAVAYPNNTVALYGIPTESTDDFEMTLTGQITEYDKVAQAEVVSGYMVQMGARFMAVPMEISAIAKNADMIQPVNFIVKKADKNPTLSGKPGVSLKDLPSKRFGLKPQVGKAASVSVKNESAGGKADGASPSAGAGAVKAVDLDSVCKLMVSNGVQWLKLSKKGEYTVKLGEQEFDHLGIDIAYPSVKYSATSLNGNLNFKKLATTRVEWDDNGYMFKVVNCFSYAQRSLYDSKGAKQALNNVYMLCPASEVKNFVFEVKVNFGIELTELKKQAAKVALSYINSGILDRADYMILTGDFSGIKMMSEKMLNEVAFSNIRMLQANTQVLKGERTYIKKHLQSLKSAIEATQDTTGVTLPAKEVCKAYKDFDAKLLEKLAEVGVDTSTGCFTPEADKDYRYVPPIAYSIPKVPAITSKDFAKTLADAKGKILSDKNPLKAKVYEPMFQYLENYTNTITSCASELDKVKFAEQCLENIDKKLADTQKLFWIYNQWCVGTVSEDSDMYVFDNGDPALVGVIGNKAECAMPGLGDVHNKYNITIDNTKIKFANAEQREEAIRKAKFKAPCPYSDIAGTYTAVKDE